MFEHVIWELHDRSANHIGYSWPEFIFFSQTLIKIPTEIWDLGSLQSSRIASSRPARRRPGPIWPNDLSWDETQGGFAVNFHPLDAK